LKNVIFRSFFDDFFHEKVLAEKCHVSRKFIDIEIMQIFFNILFLQHIFLQEKNIKNGFLRKSFGGKVPRIQKVYRH